MSQWLLYVLCVPKPRVLCACNVYSARVLCCAALRCAVAVLRCAVAVLRCAVLCCAVAVAVLCCAVLCCAVLCCAVLCCAVLCSVVLCCACRHARIPGAMQKAQSYTPPYTGTMFPWESAFTGCVSPPGW
jgi:hypothetical protein